MALAVVQRANSGGFALANGGSSPGGMLGRLTGGTSSPAHSSAHSEGQLRSVGEGEMVPRTKSLDEADESYMREMSMTSLVSDPEDSSFKKESSFSQKTDVPPWHVNSRVSRRSSLDQGARVSGYL